MPENIYMNESDKDFICIKEMPHPVSCSEVPRFRRWLWPVLAAAVVLVLIIALGVCYTKTSRGLRTVEQRVSGLSVAVQSLNSSLQQAQEIAKEVNRLQFTVEVHKTQLTSVSEALKQLSELESLRKSVASLWCSLKHVINNGTAAEGCCPHDWKQFESSCYFFSHQSLSWNNSRVWCEAHGAHLVILNTDKEWDFVTAELVPRYFWVGLSDWRTGAWEWVNHTPYVMQRRRWSPGQPDSWTEHGLGEGDEDCAHLIQNGRLNDLHCSTQLAYICQKRSVIDTPPSS